MNKVHVNTGHPSPEQLRRLALRCQSSEAIMRATKEFKCPVGLCTGKPPSSMQKAQIKLLDWAARSWSCTVKAQTLRWLKPNATAYCSGYGIRLCPANRSAAWTTRLPKVFHQAWCRPYGHPKVVFMDPDDRNILSRKMQRFLICHNIQLLHVAAESHWQLGQVKSQTASCAVWPKGFGDLSRFVPGRGRRKLCHSSQRTTETSWFFACPMVFR